MPVPQTRDEAAEVWALAQRGIVACGDSAAQRFALVLENVERVTGRLEFCEQRRSKAGSIYAALTLAAEPSCVNVWDPSLVHYFTPDLIGRELSLMVEHRRGWSIVVGVWSWGTRGGP